MTDWYARVPTTLPGVAKPNLLRLVPRTTVDEARVSEMLSAVNVLVDIIRRGEVKDLSIGATHFGGSYRLINVYTTYLSARGLIDELAHDLDRRRNGE